MSLYTYWATIFILPQSILKAIISICRNFLWAGKDSTCKTPPIAWKHISKSKIQGGLNVRDTILWNKSAMGKYIWQIALKEDNLWVKWVYIRDGNFWIHTPPYNASCAWRKLCDIRSLFSPGFLNNTWLLST